MARLKDWRQRLTTYMAAQARIRPKDCALWAAGAVEALTGDDPAADYRGKYDEIEDGLKLLRESGFESHVDLIAASLVEIDAIEAQPGDIAVIDSPAPEALGIVQGPGGIYVLSPFGVGLVPLSSAKRFFGV